MSHTFRNCANSILILVLNKSVKVAAKTVFHQFHYYVHCNVFCIKYNTALKFKV